MKKEVKSIVGIDGDRYYGGGKAEGGKEFQWKGIRDALLSRKVRKGPGRSKDLRERSPVVMVGGVPGRGRWQVQSWEVGL